MRYIVFPIAAVTALSVQVAAQDIVQPQQIVLPDAAPIGPRTDLNDYPVEPQQDRKTYTVERTRRGTSVEISEADIVRLCGDRDGCSIRVGMHNWDDTGRVASRETLFYYNRRNHAWRAEWNDLAGTNNNNATQHVLQAWSCYFTDGRYEAWTDRGDTSTAFGLLSWNQYNADCFLTIID